MRDFAALRLSIWGDDDFRALTETQQRLYFVCMSHHTLNHCGVLDWRPRRLASLSASSTVESIEQDAAGLVRALYLVIDHATEEALVRSHIRHDGLMKEPNKAVAMATAHAGIASAALRGVVVHELQRLREQMPDLKAWKIQKVAEVLEKASVDPSAYPLGNPSVNPSGKGSVKGSGKGSVDPSGKALAPVPEPITNNQTPLASKLAADDDFDRFWEVYPRRVDKGRARTAWKAARKKADADVIIDAARLYAADRTGKDQEFTKHPSSWLNAEAWLNPASSSSGFIPKPETPEEKWRRLNPWASA